MDFFNENGQLAKEFEDSRILDVHKRTDYPEINDCIKMLFKDFCQHRQSLVRRDMQTYQKCFYAVTLDLYVGWLQGKYIAYSRNRNNFNEPRLKALFLSGRHIVNVIDYLIELEFAEGVKGFIERKSGFSRLSRVTLTEKLTSLIQLPSNPIPVFSTLHPELILKDIRVKKGKRAWSKQPIEFVETEETRRIREEVQIINNQISQAPIELVLTDQEVAQLAKRLRKRNSAKFALVGTSLRRIFNNANFAEGGRFYGHWSQSIPREYRRYITINKEQVAELDFSGLHINMLYDMQRTQAPLGDVYAIDDYDNSQRPLLKVILQALINAENEKSATGAAFIAAKQAGANLTYAQVQELIDKFKAKHAEIINFFSTGIGTTLQYHDSEIARDVMLELASRNIPCLPIHDSFIVQERHAATLERAMSEAYFKKFNRHPKIDSK